MSTKIHNGFVFNTTDIMEVYKIVNDFRKQLQPLVYDKTVQYFAEECTASYDIKTISGEKVKGIFLDIHNQFTNKQDEVRIKQVRDASTDFQFSLVVIPTADKFYGLFYTEQPDFADLWAAQSSVSEYIYYDNADEPDGISLDDWKERGKVWDSLLDPFGNIPSQAGFTFNIIPEQTYDLPNIQDILKVVPSISERIAVRTKDTLFKRYCKNKKFSTNNVIKIYNEFVDYMLTDEGEVKYDDEQNRMSSKLRLTLTEQEFM